MLRRSRGGRAGMRGEPVGWQQRIRVAGSAGWPVRRTEEPHEAFVAPPPLSALLAVMSDSAATTPAAAWCARSPVGLANSTASALNQAQPFTQLDSIIWRVALAGSVVPPLMTCNILHLSHNVNWPLASDFSRLPCTLRIPHSLRTRHPAYTNYRAGKRGGFTCNTRPGTRPCRK